MPAKLLKYSNMRKRGDFHCDFCNNETNKKHLLFLHNKTAHENYTIQIKDRFVCSICLKPRCNHPR